MKALLAKIDAITSSKGWHTLADIWPALIALALPWSTSAVGIIAIFWLVSVLGTIRTHPFLEALALPASWIPVAFFSLGVLGMFWTRDPWLARLQGLEPLLRLLFLPLILYQYRRSAHAHWVFYGFLASCTILMVISWMLFFFPQMRFTKAHGFDVTGIPVRNAIDQGHEFALCCFGLIYALWRSMHRKQLLSLALYSILLGGFILNLLFVAFSRTIAVYVVPVLLLFAFKYFSGRLLLVVLITFGGSLFLAWQSSPVLRGRLMNVTIEYQQYVDANRPTSLGQRLAYWEASLAWIQRAPLLGNGTGSTKRLFAAEAAGKEGAWSEAVRNPHNQTLYVAVQWGLVGSLLLYSMWFIHLSLFRGTSFVAWIGACIVLQNMLSSLLNSHLFDFAEGWIYVLGVGVAGGLTSKVVAPAQQDLES